MKNVSIIILSTFMLSSVAWGESGNQPSTNSLSKAMLEINAMHAPVQTNMIPAKTYSNESEKNNSLSRGALAIQEAHMKTYSTDKAPHISTKSTSTHQSSFYGVVLEKQFSHYK